MESAFFEAWQASSTYKLCSRDIMSGSHLALPARCWIVYYSCLTELFTFSNYSDAVQDNRKASCPANPSGPRGIRTLDLLNAIETRSQLRYGPLKPTPGGPGGIRTRDLFSAIEARSHCATGPGCKVAELYLSAKCLSRKPVLGEGLATESWISASIYYVKLS